MTELWEALPPIPRSRAAARRPGCPDGCECTQLRRRPRLRHPPEKSRVVPPWRSFGRLPYPDGFFDDEQAADPLHRGAFMPKQRSDSNVGLAELAVLCERSIPGVNPMGRPERSFSMTPLLREIRKLPDFTDLFPAFADLESHLGTNISLQLLGHVVRTAFLIEPVVLPAATTTRFNTRWGLTAGDPRSADPADCLAIANVVIELLIELTTTEEGRLILAGVVSQRLLAYELPVGYREWRVPIHRSDNFSLFNFELLRHVAGFRLLLLDRNNPHRKVFVEAYKRKIAVKTYLTDRALTGDYKTNREKRWEAHPHSVQFALRHTCLDIELRLVNQMCHFEGFPEELQTLLRERDLLIPTESPAVCPVTLAPFEFGTFSEEVLSPTQGRSEFQVGHLDPLKLQGNTWSDGHRADNIGWISSTGNRIQGNLSVEATRAMLASIWRAYHRAGLLTSLDD